MGLVNSSPIEASGVVRFGWNLMPQLTLTLEDTGKSLQLARGQDLVIRLPENPTTGYLWKVEAFDDQILAFQGRQAAAPGPGIGSGREVIFAFKALKPGLSRIRLKRSREWVTDESGVDQRFEVSVNVLG